MEQFLEICGILQVCLPMNRQKQHLTFHIEVGAFTDWLRYKQQATT
jgi:hypothetical protein